MKKNLKTLIGYYKPYKFLFFSDLFFAMLGAAITLIIPLVVRYITNEVIYYDGGQALKTILALGGLMVVQQSMEELAKNRTTFVIAHRLSTIRNVKRILVLTENGIEEEGMHEELLAKDGAYAALYQLQFR